MIKMQKIKLQRISGLLVFISLLCFISYSYAEDIMAYPISNTVSLQAILKDAGLYKGQIDGIHGSQTKQAVKEFQKKQGLRPDGIVGRKTRDRLTRYLSEKNDKIRKLSEQLSKLQKENYFYQNQLNATYEESRKKDMQLQELTQRLKSEKEEYEAQLLQNKRGVSELQADYDDRLRLENSRVAGLVKEREQLIIESNRLKSLQFVRLQKLKVIKRDLDAVISSNL